MTRCWPRIPIALFILLTFLTTGIARLSPAPGVAFNLASSTALASSAFASAARNPTIHAYDGLVQHPGSRAASGTVSSPTLSRHERRPTAIAGIPRVAVASGFAAEAGGEAVAYGPGPQNAWKVFDRVAEKGAPLQGYKGGSVFRNGDGLLPELDSAGNPVTYREWDVNPYVKGVDRGGQRIVTGSDGSGYYTGDHYDSFTQFTGPGR